MEPVALRRPRGLGVKPCRGSLHAREIHRPVGVPRPAGVLGVRLFPAGGGRGDVRPHVADADGLAVERVVGIESADAIHERALHRRVERTVRRAAVDPPNRPLARGGVVRAHGGGGVSAAGAHEHVVLKIARAAHDWPRAARALEFHPGAGPRPQGAVMHLPVAEQEIEIVQPGEVRGRRRRRRLLGRAHRDGGQGHDHQANSQGAR